LRDLTTGEYAPGRSGPDQGADGTPGDAVKIWGSDRLRFNIRELAGSVGDFGTILPLVFAVALTAGLNLPYIFLFFGIWFIITGIYYGLPIPLEPMKVIVIVAIAEGLGAGPIAAAGLILGIVFLALGFGRWMELIERWIPQSVIRGIQLGLALLLLRTAVTFLIGGVLYFAIGVGIIILFLILSRVRNVPDVSSLVVIGIALIIGIAMQGFPPISLIPPPELVIPDLSDYTTALSQLVLPQALLTITNAILATSLLTKDLFSRQVPPKELSRTIGLMNLTTVPFGGMPMCHGAGGLAGQYRFGARTGGANVYAGLIFIVFALFFASQAFLSLIAGGFYGALLVFVALEMARHGIKTDSYIVTGVIAVLALVSSMTVAFIVGLIIAYLLPWAKNRYGRKDLDAP
jgi:hypothetical protein